MTCDLSSHQASHSNTCCTFLFLGATWPCLWLLVVLLVVLLFHPCHLLLSYLFGTLLPLGLIPPQLLNSLSLLHLPPFLLHPHLFCPHGNLYLGLFPGQSSLQLLLLLLQLSQIEGLMGRGTGLVVVVVVVGHGGKRKVMMESFPVSCSYL